MFFVALIDHTDKKIFHAEEYENPEEAKTRERQLDSQAGLNREGCNSDADPAHDWRAYLGETPFAFPVPATAAQVKAQLASAMRAQRNGLLAACDWTHVADSPLTDTQRQAWADYRQALRDVPELKGFPASIDWPVSPGA